MSLPPSIKLQGSRVLLVDDDPVNVVVLSGLLASAGYLLDEANSGESAIEKCESLKPDLIVLDVRLPGIDGFETCREIQRRHGPDSPPVIFITARNAPEDVLSGFAAGGVDYLTKPVSEREAIVRIRTHLANRLLVQQLGQALSHKNQLLGMAAHDLRNPLASIRGMAELLSEGALGSLTSAQSEAIVMFRDVSGNLLAMVNELLDVAVIEAGQFKLTPANTDLAELISKSVHLNNINAARKSTVIGFETIDHPVLAKIDAAKMRQVIDNLLTNAVKYSPPASKITITLRKEQNVLIIAVQDQGPGIPEQERSLLFKEFSTLSVKSTGGEKSTGLGLAICRRIVEAHQGTISARNLPNRGCEFSVALPSSGSDAGES
jgi:signal transduction histidine kinase